MTKTKWNLKAFREIREAPGVVADIESRTARVAAAAGDGFEADVGPGRSRVRGSVWTANANGRRKAADGVLVRAIDAGR